MATWADETAARTITKSAEKKGPLPTGEIHGQGDQRPTRWTEVKEVRLRMDKPIDPHRSGATVDSRSPHSEPSNFQQVLERMRQAGGKRDRVRLAEIMESVGRRSFGPMLLVAGIIALSPLSGIPLVPTIVGVLVVLTAGQLLLRRKHFWLPQSLSRRSLSREKLEKGLNCLQGPAGWIDRVLRQRLKFLTNDAGARVVAVICIVLAATMPPLELVPFLATTTGAAFTAFGLSLVAHDGLVGLIAFVFTGLTMGAVVLAVF